MKIINNSRLSLIADKLKKGYANAQPFPFTKIDNFFDEIAFEYILDTFPSPDDLIWKTPSNRHTKAKSVIRRGVTGLKENVLSSAACNIFYQLNSATFLNFLENLTGITGLCPDPYLNESGFHLSKNNGHLDIHADYSHHDLLKLERRLNVLIYLNKNWDKSFNGNLGLYDSDLTLIHEFEPIANRIVIFSTSRFSYHGFPDKLKLPQDYIDKYYGRKSIAMYYYTISTGREKHRIIFPEDPKFTFEETVT